MPIATHNPQTQKSLEGVKKAVQGESEDEAFYNYLVSIAPTQEEKDVLASIRNEERGHGAIFRQIYKELMATEVPPSEEEALAEKPKSYAEGLRKALFGELKAVEKYREIMKGLPTALYKDLLFDIITDELKHAAKYNYLINLNKGTSAETASRNTRQDKSTQDKSTFTPDDWVNYITPLVNRALAEGKEGISPEHLYQQFILAGVLVGLGSEPQEAIQRVEEWEKTGKSQLLAKSKMARSRIVAMSFCEPRSWTRVLSS